MRDNGELVAGAWYRITNYQCTTTQDNTQSAGHVFDILVLALDGKTLSEEARAIQHEGDTYFEGGKNYPQFAAKKSDGSLDIWHR